jgi:DtxR family transcriptional regulator, Mn-dependent transcriptional regulator
MSESTDNYLKAIYALSQQGAEYVTTTELSEKLNTKASSVTDMLKKLDSRGLVKHVKYYGVTLTEKGNREAIEIVRRHRIWEVFLSEKLNFAWDEVHEIAEQLEHIESMELIRRLDAFLEYPQFDPHGDPIPDEKGNLPAARKTVKFENLKSGDYYSIIGVNDSSTAFLEHLKKLKLSIGTIIQFNTHFEFDKSVEFETSKSKIHLSETAVSKLVFQKHKKKA